MTREEAIEKLKFESVRQQLMWDNELNEAIKMAIEALEDILEMSVAIDTITYTEGYTYGFDNELKMALKWIEREGK